MIVDDDLLARVAIAQVCEPGERRVESVIDQGGAIAMVERLQADPSQLRKPDLGAAAIELDRCQTLGVRLITPASPEWPPRLDDLGPRRPVLLWVLGPAELSLASRRSVAIVGARAASTYGVSVASDLGSDLAQADWTVVSGGAYGIDAAAHRGVVAAGGITVAALACGVNVAYPKGNESLFARIAQRGLLVSEVPLDGAPRRLRFLVRNRVIAALTLGTVVVEAAVRSGALGTAAEAGRLNRQVMAVPGPIDSFVSAGAHRAIRDGATLVTSAAEVIEQVGELGVDLAPEPNRPKRPRDLLSQLARTLLEFFPAHEAVAIGDVAVCAGLTAAAVPVVLTELVTAGMVRPAGERWELTPRARA